MNPAGVSRRELLVGAGLTATAAASGLLARSAAAGASTLDLRMPDVVGPWTRSAADGVLIPQGEQPEDQPYDDVATGYYTSASAPSVMLLIAYGSAQTGTTQLHRPEVCYPAAGFHIRDSRERALTLGARSSMHVRTMTAEAAGRIEQILYWSRVGPDYPTSAMQQRWAVLRQTLHGSVPDGALVRMSIIDGSAAAAMPWLRQFAAALVGTADDAMRRLLVGRA